MKATTTSIYQRCGYAGQSKSLSKGRLKRNLPVKTIISGAVFLIAFFGGLYWLQSQKLQPGECDRFNLTMGGAERCLQLSPTPTSHVSLITNGAKAAFVIAVSYVQPTLEPQTPGISPITTNYLTGKWNFSGYSKGAAISGPVIFKGNGSYELAGRIINAKDNNTFVTSGTYSIKPPNTLLFTSSSNMHGLYLLADSRSSSFFMYNNSTSEYYNVNKGIAPFPEVPRTNALPPSNVPPPNLPLPLLGGIALIIAIIAFFAVGNVSSSFGTKTETKTKR